MRKSFIGIIIICFVFAGCGKQETQQTKSMKENKGNIPPQSNRIPADKQSKSIDDIRNQRHLMDITKIFERGNFGSAPEEFQKFSKTVYETIINGDETAFLNLCGTPIREYKTKDPNLTEENLKNVEDRFRQRNIMMYKRVKDWLDSIKTTEGALTFGEVRKGNLRISESHNMPAKSDIIFEVKSEKATHHVIVSGITSSENGKTMLIEGGIKYID